MKLGPAILLAFGILACGSQATNTPDCVGAACGTSTSTVLFQGDVYALPLQVDDTSIYFARGSSSAREIDSIPKGAVSSASKRIFPESDTDLGQLTYWSFAVRGDSLYACSTGIRKEIVTIPTAGGVARVLATLPSTAKSCYGLAVTRDTVYVSIDHTADKPAPAIYGVPLSGGSLAQLAGSYANSFVFTDDSSAYFKGGHDANGPKCNSDPSLSVGIRKVSLSAPASVELICIGESSFQLPSFAGGVVAAISSFTNISVFSLDPMTSISSHVKESASRSVITDGTEVFWSREASTGTGGTTVPAQNASIQKAPVHGGNPVMLTSGGRFPGSLAVDAAQVYFIDSNMADGGSGNVIARVPR